MKKELEQKLIEDFPHLFSGKDKPITENLMPFGCECGDGWHGIIRTACEVLENHYYNNPPEEERPYFMQIKEKYGTLRMYFTHYNDIEDTVEGFAEYISARVCEECGCPGKARPGGWIKTLCDKCVGDN